MRWLAASTNMTLDAQNAYLCRIRNVAITPAERKVFEKVFLLNRDSLFGLFGFHSFIDHGLHAPLRWASFKFCQVSIRCLSASLFSHGHCCLYLLGHVHFPSLQQDTLHD